MKQYLFLAILLPSFGLLFFESLQTGLKSSSILNIFLIIWTAFLCKMPIKIFIFILSILLLIIYLYVFNQKIYAISVARYLELYLVFYSGYSYAKLYEIYLPNFLRIIITIILIIIIFDILDLYIPFYPNIDGGWIKGHVSGPFALNYQLGLVLGSVAILATNISYPPGLKRGILYATTGLLVYLITLSRGTLMGFILITLLNIFKFSLSKLILIGSFSFLVFFLMYDLSIVSNLFEEASLSFRFRLWNCLYESFDEIFLGDPNFIISQSWNCVHSQSLSTESLQIRLFFNHGLLIFVLILILLYKYIGIFKNDITKFSIMNKSQISTAPLPLEFITFGIGYSIFSDGLITAHAGSIFWLLFGLTVGSNEKRRRSCQ
jgi:hypothetical protein